MIASFLTLTGGQQPGMGDIEYAKKLDFHVPPDFLALFAAPPPTSPDSAHPGTPRSERRPDRRQPSSSRSWACARSPSPTPVTPSGWAATSSRTTSRSGIRCSRR
jgi:hypothetical protein